MYGRWKKRGRKSEIDSGRVLELGGGRIVQHCAMFHNRKSTQSEAGSTTKGAGTRNTRYGRRGPEMQGTGGGDRTYKVREAGTGNTRYGRRGSSVFLGSPCPLIMVRREVESSVVRIMNTSYIISLLAAIKMGK